MLDAVEWLHNNKMNQQLTSTLYVAAEVVLRQALMQMPQLPSDETQAALAYFGLTIPTNTGEIPGLMQGLKDKTVLPSLSDMDKVTQQAETEFSEVSSMLDQRSKQLGTLRAQLVVTGSDRGAHQERQILRLDVVRISFRPSCMHRLRSSGICWCPFGHLSAPSANNSRTCACELARTYQSSPRRMSPSVPSEAGRSDLQATSRLRPHSSRHEPCLCNIWDLLVPKRPQTRSVLLQRHRR